MPGHSHHILYLLKHFPCLSQTFILNEVKALTGLGHTVSVVSAIDLGESIVLPPGIAERLVYLRHDYLYRYGEREPMPIGALAAEADRALRSCAGLLSRDERNDLHRLVGEVEFDHETVCRGFLECLDVANLIRDRGVDHIHCDFAEDNVKLAGIVSRVTGVPFSFKMRAYDIFAEPRPEIPDWAAAASRVITISRYNQTYIAERWGVPSDRVNVIYDGLDLHALPEPGPYSNDPLTIVSVARLVEKKGLHVLVEACALLQQRGVAFRCVCVGDGPLQSMLEAAIAAHGLQDRVSLPGRMNHHSALHEISRASVFVLPCVEARNGDRDATPNTLLEAMALCRPVVSTRVSGIPEMIEDGVDGLLVDPDDADALADAIARLAADTQLAVRLGRRARKTVERRFRIERTAAELIALLG